eukprot:TRINITY_DN21289_c0_g1_i1.p1 TRINITY_DN21289_c0_g1~~TRINITY_DN21289_c0_g1_i1.p1  ORF type:complete len:104 (+),score=14.70 TRINITY_DN21289_c0_g1_i1:137-448(+)
MRVRVDEYGEPVQVTFSNKTLVITSNFKNSEEAYGQFSGISYFSHDNLSLCFPRKEIMIKAIAQALRVRSESIQSLLGKYQSCLLYTSPSPRDRQKSRMPSSA